MESPESRRHVVGKLTAVFAVVCVLVLGGAAFMLADGSTQPASVSEAKTKPAARTSAVPVPNGGSVKQKIKPVEAGDVVKAGLSGPARLPRDITVKVESVASKTVKPGGPGEQGGPSIVITVAVKNGSTSPINVDSAIVNLSYGEDSLPGLPLTADPSKPLAGVVAPGKTARAVYVFGVPKSDRNPIVVNFAYSAGASVARFVGAAS